MINDSFLPLQSLQRGSRIEIIQNTDIFLSSASRAGGRRYHWPQNLTATVSKTTFRLLQSAQTGTDWALVLVLIRRVSRGAVSQTERGCFSHVEPLHSTAEAPFRFADCKASESISDECCKLSNMTVFHEHGGSARFAFVLHLRDLNEGK